MLFRIALLVVSIHATVCGADTFTPRQPWTTSKVQGSPLPALPYKVEVAFPNLKFRSPTGIKEVPGSRLMVTEIGGKIFTFPKLPETAERTLVANLADLSGGNVALHDATLHPDFEDNRWLFVCHTHPDGKARLARYTVTDSVDFKIKPDTEQVLLQWPAGGHGGGCMEFGPDGLLYVSTGDGSGPVPPDALTTGQDVSDLLGAVLRIDVNHSDGEKHFAVPDTNPFVGMEGVRPEIWSFGLRNPWKFGIDSQSGEVFVADNGWETWEVIHKLHAGSNCGWPIMEGRAPLRTEVPRGPTPITPPVKDHPHTEANSVVGGPIYRGSMYPELDGWFIYGDYITGTIWALNTNEGYAHRTLGDTDLHIVAFEQGRDGEIFLLDYDQTGQLYQLVRSDRKDTSASFPRKLSETGLFKSVDRLEPADGVVPYSVVSEPWADGAVAQRWVAIPGTEEITLAKKPDAESRFPNGTVLVKHLTLPRPDHRHGNLPVETQILHFESGTWNPYSYLWNQDGSDATLVGPNGTDTTIQQSDEPSSTRTWHVGSVNECRLCHSAGSGFIAGFTAKQLRKTIVRNEERYNQINALVQRRVLTRTDLKRESDSAFVNPHDQSKPLDARARSYLHANCGVCHHRKGPATISFFAHADYPFQDLRITKRPGIGRFGLDSPQLVKPGAPNSSVILYRMSKLGYGRMPYIGSRVVDSRGVSLIAEWIKSMETADRNSPPTQTDHEKAITSLAAANESGEQAVASLESLLQSTTGAMALATATHRGDFSDNKIKRITTAAGTKHGDIRGLFDHFIPESQRRRTLGPNPDTEKILLLAGDSARGELIFLSDNNRCRTCHDVSDASKSIGPTLNQIRRIIKRPELLLHIIEPSRRVDDRFATWTIVTGDGRSESGLLVSDKADSIELRKADGAAVTIKRSDIESMKKSAQSLMPNGLLSDMTAQQAADLLAFLIDKTKP